MGMAPTVAPRPGVRTTQAHSAVRCQLKLVCPGTLLQNQCTRASRRPRSTCLGCMRHLPHCHASLQLLELGGVQPGSSPLLCAAAASGGYPGTPPGAAPDVSGLLGQGMTAAGLHTILQQQSHRMPPDVVRIRCPGLHARAA